MRDAVLCYEVRGNDVGARPVLLLIGSPVGAAGFGTQAGGIDEPDAFAAAVREVLNG